MKSKQDEADSLSIEDAKELIYKNIRKQDMEDQNWGTLFIIEVNKDTEDIQARNIYNNTGTVYFYNTGETMGSGFYILKMVL